MTAVRKFSLPPALTAFALGEPIQPLGYLPNGRPIFPIAGGAPDDPPEGGDGGQGGNDDGNDGGGKKFEAITSQEELDRIIGNRLARERERFADYDEIKRKAAEHDAALEAAKSEHEKAVDAARTEGEKTALGRANSRLVAAEARALAAEAKFRNPALAVRGIELADVKVNDDGTVDAEAIRAKLKALSDADPYLIDDGKKPTPKPDGAQGGGDRRTRAGLSGLDGDSLYERLHPKKTA